MGKFNAPIVYNGDFAKVLKSKLKLDESFQVISAAIDPTAVATDAPIGSMLIHSTTGVLYFKLDNGSSTNWKRNEQTVIEYLGALTNEPTGFPNRTSSTISWVDGTLTFTVAPTGSTFDVYIKGAKLSLTSKSVVFTDTEGLWYAYINSSGTLVATQTFDATNIIVDNAFVASWYWDATNNESNIRSDERHGISMDSATHSYLHSTFGTRYVSGLALNSFSINTGAAGTVVTANAQFGSDAGVIADEDIRHSLGAVVSTTGFPVFYKSGASGAWRRQVADGVPVSFTATRANWNNINAGGAGVWGLTAVTNNGDYFLMHLFATNDVNQPVIAIVGQAQYTTAALARVGATEELNSLLLSGLPLVEFKAIGTVIYQTDSGYTGVTKHVRVVEAVSGGADYVDWRNAQVSGNLAGVTDHGSLSGLADDDHLQYARTDGSRDITGVQTFNNDIIIVDQASIATAGAGKTRIGAISGVLSYYDSVGGAQRTVVNTAQAQSLGSKTFIDTTTFNTNLVVDTINEKTAAAGVTADGTKLKDGAIHLADVATPTAASDTVVLFSSTDSRGYEKTASGNARRLYSGESGVVCLNSGATTITATGATYSTVYTAWTEDFDLGANFASGVFTVPTGDDGYYHIDATFSMDVSAIADALHYIYAGICLNGSTTPARVAYMRVPTTGAYQLRVTAIVALSGGSTVDFRLKKDSQITTLATYSASNETWASIIKLRGLV